MAHTYPSLALMGVVGMCFMTFMALVHGRSVVRYWGTTSRDIDLLGAGLLALLVTADVFFAYMFLANTATR